MSQTRERKSKRFIIYNTILYYYDLPRKMMNRIAAQNARDRKKNYLDSLEKKLALLEEEVACIKIVKIDFIFF